MGTNYKEIATENIKKYGTDIGKYGPVLLTGLYSDRTHFIYEIIQNAEDAGARIGKNVQITFNLFKDRLEVRHNGKLFDEADVRGICGLVEGTKKDNLTQIGKFGIGFKSVYAYTNSPKIYSGDESFCVKNYVLPEAIEKINISENETIFIFPFNHSEVHSEQAFEEIANRLRNIGTRTLLFLRYIEEISWNINKEESGIYIREVKTKVDHKETYILSRVGEDEHSEKREEWIVFEKLFKLDIFGVDKLRIEVAFKIGKDKNDKKIIVEAENCKLSVFFPTIIPTYLKFLIQGPYKTTANRESIPLGDEQNKSIIKETLELISESISRIKRLGYLDVNFLNILPIIDPRSASLEGERIYAEVYEKVKSKLLSDEELLPTNDGRYTKASDALLAGSKYLTGILNQKDIEFLFSKKNWLSTEITYDRTKELRKYLLSELGINEIEFKNFAENISSEFLEKKSDEWMIRFYCQLLSQDSLWCKSTWRHTEEGILRKKPIIRLKDNSHIAPYDEFGNIQVYLPTERKSEYKTIKNIFTKDEGSLQFLKELGVKKPDIFAEIKEFVIPKYHGEKIISEINYFEDLEKIITAFSKGSDDDTRKELLNQLSKLKFIKAVNLISKEEKLLKPYEVYLNSEELRRYFDGYKPAFFVSDKLYSRYEEGILTQFLKAVGVEDKPRRLEVKKILSGEEKKRFIDEHIDGSPIMRNREISKADYEYEGLLNIMKYINKDKSMLLWRMLLRSIEELNSWSNDFFKGRYHWEYRGNCSRSVDAAFLIFLRKNLWLFDKDDKLKHSSEITFSELSDGYEKQSRNIKILREELKFKPDSFDQLPEDVKRKCEITKDRSIEEIKKALKLLDEQKIADVGKNERQWIPEYESEELVDTESEIVTPQPYELPNVVDQGPRLKGFIISDKDRPEEEREKEKNVPMISPIQKKEIGKWGEKCVMVYLKNQYKKLGNIIDTETGFYVSCENNKIEIYWLNIKSEIGKGCDFVISKNGIESNYIEVKTKLRDENELIEITGTQWEFARKLFDNNDGDKYWIYIVVNAGKEYTKIKKLQNPIKKWKDGRLYAHPIHFKL
ncbi:MAG: DUF3883 domain-containing protein [Actinomycetia bacterium]|nr:DUF3883 domain-containing protein [Actinomycetes bacterium]